MPVVRVSHLHDVTMSTSKVHQTAPGGQGAHFRVVHDAVPQFGGCVVLHLIAIDFIRGTIGDHNIIGVITIGRRNNFQHTHRTGLFFGEGTSDDEGMTSCGNHNLCFLSKMGRNCSACVYYKGCCRGGGL